ncbi:MAG: hypothetical protein IJD28_07815 [Deferribacterales bacterium]|nr:hypothetical protein [Deferribacterales bacterium]
MPAPVFDEPMERRRGMYCRYGNKKHFSQGIWGGFLQLVAIYNFIF